MTNKDKRIAPQYPLKGCGIRGSHKARKARKFSSTPGHTKAGCKSNPLQKAYCRRNRSYRWENYLVVMASIGHSKAQQS